MIESKREVIDDQRIRPIIVLATLSLLFFLATARLDRLKPFSSLVGASARNDNSINKERMVSAQPANGEENVPLNQTVAIAFDRPMAQRVTEKAFPLHSANGEEVQGYFSWNEDFIQMKFTPDLLLHLGTGHVGRIGGAAQTAKEEIALGETYTWTFTMVPHLYVLMTSPVDGESGVGPDTPVEIQFSAPVDTATVLPNIEIRPQPTCVYTYWSPYDYWGKPLNRFGLLWNLQPATSYEVRIGSGIADPYGNQIEGRTLHFSTRPLISLDYFREWWQKWWMQNKERVMGHTLLGLVIGLMATFLILLLLPSRTDPIRILPRHILLSLGILLLSISTFVALVQMREWIRSPASRCAITRGSPTPIGDATVYDFIANLDSPDVFVETPQEWYVGAGQMTLKMDSRPVLRMHPPASVQYTLDVPPRARLRFSIALDPEVWHPDRGDGVLFTLRVLTEEGEEVVFSQVVDPKHRPEDRAWRDVEVDLAPYAGRNITIVFATHPLETNDWDWAGWGMPIMVASSPE